MANGGQRARGDGRQRRESAAHDGLLVVHGAHVQYVSRGAEGAVRHRTVGQAREAELDGETGPLAKGKGEIAPLAADVHEHGEGRVDEQGFGDFVVVA
jgi:hypothetical protein